MKNQVIKVLSLEHGKKVIKYWKSRGVDTSDYEGGRVGFYYGIVDGWFYYWPYVPRNTEVIELLEEKPKFNPPFRVGKKLGRAVLDANGKELVVFKEGGEEYANKFVEYLNNPYPKVMMVSNYPITEDNKGFKRVVFMEKGGYFLAWDTATTIEESEEVLTNNYWWNAVDVPKEPEFVELTLQDISDGKGVGVPVDKIRIKQ